MDADLRIRTATARRLAAQIGTPNLARALLASARDLDERFTGGPGPSERTIVPLCGRAPQQT
ncbi:hypothetical protein [Brevundimonas lutea]|uniref:hypothetical protein n=1 Tax=Brevundimonas lutea TaxID=2293980 RepID=UPI000F01699A|nr:hypothetical protein [Brevundimonas lutea]